MQDNTEPLSTFEMQENNEDYTATQDLVRTMIEEEEQREWTSFKDGGFTVTPSHQNLVHLTALLPTNTTTDIYQQNTYSDIQYPSPQHHPYSQQPLPHQPVPHYSPHQQCLQFPPQHVAMVAPQPQISPQTIPSHPSHSLPSLISEGGHESPQPSSSIPSLEENLKEKIKQLEEQLKLAHTVIDKCRRREKKIIRKHKKQRSYHIRVVIKKYTQEINQLQFDRNEEIKSIHIENNKKIKEIVKAHKIREQKLETVIREYIKKTEYDSVAELLEDKYKQFKNEVIDGMEKKFASFKKINKVLLDKYDKLNEYHKKCKLNKC